MTLATVGITIAVVSVLISLIYGAYQLTNDRDSLTGV